MCPIAMLLEGVRIKESDRTERTNSFMPRWVQCTWVQMAAWKDEGPSGAPLSPAVIDPLGVS